MTTYKIESNTQYNSTEVFFESKPERTTIDSLKAVKFRWNPRKGCWYGFLTIEEVEAILKGEKAPETPKAQKAPKTNKFGIKVGDYFSSSWGYEQTNVDFFQVVELVGECSVRVKEVYPEMIGEEAVSGMSADRTYKLDTSKMARVADRSVFIKDQEHGDLKRLKSYAADGKSNPLFNLDTFATARYCGTDTVTKYESWYY